MDRTKLSSKGQIVLPKSVRDSLKWPPGIDLTVEEGEDFVVLRRSRVFPGRTAKEVAGCLKYHGRPVSVAEMEKAVDDEMRERWRRKSR